MALQKFLLGATLAAAAAACGDHVLVKRGGDGGAGATTTSSAGAGPSTATASTSTVTTSASGGSSQGGSGQGGSCVAEVWDAEHETRPVDAIVVVESSFNFQEELAALEQQLHPSFAALLDQAGLDAQIIVIADHGAGPQELCVPPPLSSSSSCSGAPGNVSGKFQHYSVQITGFDSLCKSLSTLYGNTPDEFMLATGGWSSWLRPQALKAFVSASASGAFCTWGSHSFQDVSNPSAGQQVALDWDTALLSLAPSQFGTVAARNYLFEALVGIVPKGNNEPYEPFEPVVTQGCNFNSAGTGYQWLARGTEALRASSCDPQTLAVALSAFAADVIDRATDRCTIHIPEGENPFELELLYHPGQGPTEVFTGVGSPEQCGPNGFYVEDTVLTLCEEACAVVEADPDGELQVRAPCPMP